MYVSINSKLIYVLIKRISMSLTKRAVKLQAVSKHQSTAFRAIGLRKRLILQ